MDCTSCIYMYLSLCVIHAEDEYKKELEIEGKKRSLCIVDTAGQVKIQCLQHMQVFTALLSVHIGLLVLLFMCLLVNSAGVQSCALPLQHSRCSPANFRPE